MESLRQGVWAKDAAVVDFDLIVAEHPLFARRVDQATHLMAARYQFPHHAPPQKPGGSRNQNQQDHTLPSPEFAWPAANGSNASPLLMQGSGMEC